MKLKYIDSSLFKINSYVKELLFIRNISFVLITLFISCKKFVQVSTPQNQLTTASVFSSDATATSAMSGIYSNIMGNTFASGNGSSLTFLGGLLADELINYSNSPNQVQFANNNLSPTNSTAALHWNTSYQSIYAVNAVLEGLASSKGISDPTKNQLTGEAKFIRAFSYFYLVNLFGPVPMDTTTDYKKNALARRAPVKEVYKQIITDLANAQTLLSPDYSFVNGERVKPNKWAATALLARVYLYMGDWGSAEIQSTTIINNTSQFSLVGNLDSVFLANSTEAIWQLRPISTTLNTNEGNIFILTGRPSNVALSTSMLNAFDSGDLRQSHWVGSKTVGTSTYYFPYKYKIKSGAVLTEYSMVLRLAEQYLIRAEARAQEGRPEDAAADLNIIRYRAGLPNKDVSNKEELLSAIYHERQVELFTEWGHRWLDLVRTGQAEIILKPLKSSWVSSAILYPLPLIEIQNNPNESQNLGY